jgi:hypothetical protein
LNEDFSRNYFLRFGIQYMNLLYRLLRQMLYGGTKINNNISGRDVHFRKSNQALRIGEGFLSHLKGCITD